VLDGLHGMVSDPGIAKILVPPPAPWRSLARLVDAANEAAGATT